MKTAIINLLGNVPIRKNSHSAGWNYVIASIIEDRYKSYPDFINKPPTDLNKYDLIVINNGVNYKSNKFNFFGGVQQGTIDKLIALSTYNNKLISFNESVDFRYLLKRKEITTIPNREVSTEYTFKDKMIVGDSHSVSIYEKGYGILRLDGKTLHGFLKDPYTYINFDELKEVTLYFGNIDVRFHLCRQEDPVQATFDLIDKYVEFIGKLTSQGKKVTVQGLLPIEDISRKIPNTGLYKDRPYFGTQEQRNWLREEINFELRRQATNHNYTYQPMWLNYPLEFFMMESRQSVHICPDWYLNKDFIDVE